MTLTPQAESALLLVAERNERPGAEVLKLLQEADAVRVIKECPVCGGTGRRNDGMPGWPPVFVTCYECRGKPKESIELTTAGATLASHIRREREREARAAIDPEPKRPSSRIAGKTAGFDQPGREHTAGDALGLRRDR